MNRRNKRQIRSVSTKFWIPVGYPTLRFRVRAGRRLPKASPTAPSAASTGTMSSPNGAI